MQSSGGLVSDEGAVARPVRIIESGPAAGVIAAAAAGRAAGFENLIAFDMGGTTAKASIIERGEIHLSPEYEVGSEVSRSSRLIKGGGHLIRIPAIDIAEVGAGGGSIAWIDPGGVMRVGPESAGAAPGPACYCLGGERPTVTDANVVLGRIDLKVVASHALEPRAGQIWVAGHGIARNGEINVSSAFARTDVQRGEGLGEIELVTHTE